MHTLAVCKCKSGYYKLWWCHGRVGHEESNVYVIGDAAAFPLLRRGGDLQNVQHVQHARHAPRPAEAPSTV